MAPTLPSITINDQTKFDRVVAAFGDVASYRAWLRRQVIDEVSRVESKKVLDLRDAEAEAIRREAEQSLGSM